MKEYNTFFIDEYEDQMARNRGLNGSQVSHGRMGPDSVSFRSVPLEIHEPINRVRHSFKPSSLLIFPIEEKQYSTVPDTHTKGSHRSLLHLDHSLAHEESFLEFKELDKPRTPYSSYKSIFFN